MHNNPVIMQLVSDPSVNDEYSQKISELDRRLKMNNLSYEHWDTLNDRQRETFVLDLFMDGDSASSIENYVENAYHNCDCPDVVDDLEQDSPALMARIQNAKAYVAGQPAPARPVQFESLLNEMIDNLLTEYVSGRGRGKRRKKRLKKIRRRRRRNERQAGEKKVAANEDALAAWALEQIQDRFPNAEIKSKGRSNITLTNTGAKAARSPVSKKMRANPPAGWTALPADKEKTGESYKRITLSRGNFTRTVILSQGTQGEKGGGQQSATAFEGNIVYGIRASEDETSAQEFASDAMSEKSGIKITEKDMSNEDRAKLKSDIKALEDKKKLSPEEEKQLKDLKNSLYEPDPDALKDGSSVFEAIRDADAWGGKLKPPYSTRASGGKVAATLTQTYSGLVESTEPKTDIIIHFAKGDHHVSVKNLESARFSSAQVPEIKAILAGAFDGQRPDELANLGEVLDQVGDRATKTGLGTFETTKDMFLDAATKSASFMQGEFADEAAIIKNPNASASDKKKAETTIKQGFQKMLSATLGFDVLDTKKIQGLEIDNDGRVSISQDLKREFQGFLTQKKTEAEREKLKDTLGGTYQKLIKKMKPDGQGALQLPDADAELSEMESLAKRAGLPLQQIKENVNRALAENGAAVSSELNSLISSTDGRARIFREVATGRNKFNEDEPKAKYLLKWSEKDPGKSEYEHMWKGGDDLSWFTKKADDVRLEIRSRSVGRGVQLATQTVSDGIQRTDTFKHEVNILSERYYNHISSEILTEGVFDDLMTLTKKAMNKVGQFSSQAWKWVVDRAKSLFELAKRYVSKLIATVITRAKQSVSALMDTFNIEPTEQGLEIDF